MIYFYNSSLCRTCSPVYACQMRRTGSVRYFQFIESADYGMGGAVQLFWLQASIRIVKKK